MVPNGWSISTWLESVAWKDRRFLHLSSHVLSLNVSKQSHPRTCTHSRALHGPCFLGSFLLLLLHTFTTLHHRLDSLFSLSFFIHVNLLFQIHFFTHESIVVIKYVLFFFLAEGLANLKLDQSFISTTPYFINKSNECRKLTLK